MHAHNTFENPNAVKSSPLSVDVAGGMVNVTLPAASVVKIEISVT
jgi:alpha-L-arabinofuranosidase